MTPIAAGPRVSTAYGQERRRRRGAGSIAGICVTILLAACGSGADARQPPVNDTGSPATPATSAPLELTAELVRSRRDEANQRLRIEVTNMGDQLVVLDGVRLVAPPYEPEPAQLRDGSELGSGQTIAYRIVHGAPECVGDHPAPGTVQVEITAGDRHVTLDPGDSVDLIRRMLDLDCARQRILDVVSIRLDSEWEVSETGTEQTGTLLIERLDGGPPLTVTAVRGAISYTLSLLEPETHPTLSAEDHTLTVPVHSQAARCDGHAMGDNSKPYVFSVWISLDGGPETPIEFSAADQHEDFLRLCESLRR